MKRQGQRGITLIISLIMLVLLTIMALTSFNIGKSSLQVVGNAQQQAQVLNAAQTMLNQIVSSPTFTEARPTSWTIPIAHRRWRPGQQPLRGSLRRHQDRDGGRHAASARLPAGLARSSLPAST